MALHMENDSPICLYIQSIAYEICTKHESKIQRSGRIRNKKLESVKTQFAFNIGFSIKEMSKTEMSKKEKEKWIIISDTETLPFLTKSMWQK